ncbi:amino acid transporter [Angomonas deanei]|nr:amino acid transporter [Angomonas deanei]|eukprot:EPY24446.1 amino acid transporter [Angomonas deanei]
MFNLASVTLGAGIMSIPSSFNTSGMIMAIIYLVVVTILTVYSITLLVTASEKSGLRSFESLARGLFGRGGDFFVAFLMWLLCFGGAIGYVVGIGDVFTAFFQHESAPKFLREGDGGRRVFTSVVWILFMLPLVLPKHVNSLRYVSAIGVCFIIFFVICVIIHSGQFIAKNGFPQDLVMFRSGNQAISGLSLFMFAYLCQVNCFKIFYEMKKPSVKKMTIEAGLSCGICCLMYFLTGFFGYANFGANLTGNALKYYNPYSSPMFFVCFIGFIVKLCAAFSLNMLACRTAIFQVLHWDVETMPYWKHTLISVPFAVAALILGLFLPDISVVFGLVGAFCGGFIGFLFPALFVMYSGNWSLKTVGLFHYLATYFLMICGVIAVVWGTGSTILETVIKYS